VHAVIGAAIEVHRTLGPGFLESVYEEALCFELSKRAIDIERQVEVPIKHKGHAVGKGRLDILVEKKLIVELKTVENFVPMHQAQVISYLKVSGLQLGLLVNFKVPVLKQGIKRIILS